MKIRIPNHLLSILVCSFAASICSAQYTNAWTATYNGPTQNSLDGSARTVTDEAGNVYHLGTQGMQGSGITADYVLKKYDRFGSLLWSFTYNGDGDSQDIVEDLAYRDGFIYLVGRVYRPINWYADTDQQTIKLDAFSGQQVWERKFSGEFISGQESSLDGARALAIGPNGEVYITGYTWEWNYFYPNADFCTLKYDPNGNLQWFKKYHGGATFVAISDQSYLAAVDGNGDLIISGDSPGPNNSSEIATIKYSQTDGSVLWSHRSGTIGPAYRGVPISLQISSTDDVYVAGMVFNNTLGVIKYSGSTGTPIWSYAERVGHMGIRAAFDVAPNDDVVVGVTYDPDVDDSNLNNNTRTIRLRNADGFKLWQRDFGNSVFGDYQAVRAVTVLPNDKTIVCGVGPETPYNTRLMLLQYDGAGNLEWNYIHTPIPQPIETRSLELDPFGALVVGGHYAGPSSTDLITLKFVPELDIVPPMTVGVSSGSIFYGSAGETATSDNVRMGYLPNESDGTTRVNLTGKALFSTAQSIEIEVESRASRTDLTLVIKGKNYQSGQFETLRIVPASLVDSTNVISIPANAARFVNSSNRHLELNIEWVPTSDISDVDGWEMAIDCVQWRIRH